MIRKVRGGYKVMSHTKPGKAFSKKPMSRKKAAAQLRAIEASKHGTLRDVKGMK